MDERRELISSISDTYKDLYGVRPRHIRFSEISIEELRERYECLARDLERALAFEEEERALDQAMYNRYTEPAGRLTASFAECLKK